MTTVDHCLVAVNLNNAFITAMDNDLPTAWFCFLVGWWIYFSSSRREAQQQTE